MKLRFKFLQVKISVDTKRTINKQTAKSTATKKFIYSCNYLPVQPEIASQRVWLPCRRQGEEKINP